jgi:hypothetical protein
MSRKAEPTDPAREREHGRVPVWLDPDDVRWLARRLAGEDGGTEEENKRVGRLRFRLLTALHKARLPNDIWAEE